jgi:eukaryotic-like serine/threonine-protein kinase
VIPDRINGPVGVPERGNLRSISSAQRPSQEAQIHEAIGRIRASSAFQKSARLLEFLEFVLEAKLRGEESFLKETYIGVGLYHRDPSYDTKLDSIVRTQARRVRERLAEYYRTEGAADPVVIRLAKGGYVPVVEFRPVELPRTDVAAQNPPAVRPQNRWPYAVGGVALALVAVTFWLIRPLPPPRVAGTVKITSDGLPKWQPIRVAGSRLVYSSGLDGNDVNQVSMRSGDTVAVPMQDRGKFIDLSPDGTELLVGKPADLQTRSVSMELWVAPLEGGVPRRLGSLMAEGPAAAWSPDGQQVIYAFHKELHLARRDGTKLRKLATTAGIPVFLRWSPDGSRVRFSQRDDHGTKLSLWDVSVDSGSLRPLLAGWNPAMSLCCGSWSPDGRYFLFEATGKGSSNIFAIRERPGFHWRGSEPVQITTGPMSAYAPVFSPDGKRVFINGFQDRREFVRYDLRSGQMVTEFNGVSGTQMEHSKDGRWVTWVSVPDRALWRSGASGSQRLQLTSPPMTASVPHWSPDGRRIAFFGGPSDAPPRIYIVPFEGGPAEQVTHGEAGGFGDTFFNWSPDGSSIVWGSFGNSPAGETPLHRIDLETRAVSTLPGSEGMFSPHWSPDGRWIAGLTGGSQMTISLYDVEARKQTVVSRVRSGWPNWSRAGESLYFLQGEHGQAWWRFRMSDRKLERVTALENIQVGQDGWFAAGPSDTLITTRGIGNDEIYALDWEAP